MGLAEARIKHAGYRTASGRRFATGRPTTASIFELAEQVLSQEVGVAVTESLSAHHDDRATQADNERMGGHCEGTTASAEVAPIRGKR